MSPDWLFWTSFTTKNRVPISQLPLLFICLRTFIFIWDLREVQITDLIYLLTYLLTPWCRVLEKLTGLQLVKKFPAFHGTWRFITALTSVRHLSLSWASPIQSLYPHPTSWRFILILSTHLCLGLPSVLLPPVSPAKPYTPPPLLLTLTGPPHVIFSFPVTSYVTYKYFPRNTIVLDTY